MSQRWKILIVWDNGEQEHVRLGDEDAVFNNKSDAVQMIENMRPGFDGVASATAVRVDQPRKGSRS